ncbi:MAG: class A beta-lactamase-related serine hydrolase [Reyranella sp.]|uniref:serine hydrolase domain-containing protein n=1 Tax=Reyranella sp. TaxID=1929291 RepID=UPI00120FFA76|nr:serine hydrolase domain-containing protein [Reyranella sp.]TAJ38345.1 MAG: class A beta-lactamase-related serine hydrolase [Reyranella sp.]
MSKAIGSITLERRVDALFSRYTAAGSPGAVVGVMRGGTIELCKGYGLASIELGVPIGPATRFRIASVSKQFTVTAALMLAAEGKLKLTDPPHKYLPELAPLPVTIDQMMRNCSGLPDFLELLRLGGHGLDKPARPAELLAACLRNRHLNFAPGSRFLYSNTNFLLLGLIVEGLAKKALGEFLAERIFRPLGMTGTMLAPEIDTVIPGLATGYLGDAASGFRRAAHAYPQGGEGGLTSTVEDLLIWSRHFDQPALEPRTLPAQLAAVAPLTGGHANKYRRGVQADDLRGLATIGHGGLWPGFRTEFLRIPDADLTVVVIANLGSIDPWRQARAIAALALEGNRKLKPLAAPITAAEIKPIAGSWFNAQEPSLFDLAWRGGEGVVTQNGLPFALGRRSDGWFAAERGSFEFALKPGRAGTLRVDLGAGRVVTFTRLGRRKPVPAAIAGTYVSPDAGAVWNIRRDGEDYTMAVGGPLTTGGAPWHVRGIDADTVEVVSPAGWITATQLAHLERDRAGRVVALGVSTGRIKRMRFERAS